MCIPMNTIGTKCKCNAEANKIHRPERSKKKKLKNATTFFLFIIVLEMLLNEPLEFYDHVIYVHTVLKLALCNFDKLCIGFGFGGFPRTEIVK